MRVGFVSLFTVSLGLACGGATEPQQPVVTAFDDAGDLDSPVNTEPSCIAGEIACDNLCTNPLSDSKHCGTCGHVCSKGTRCFDGECSGDGG